MGNQDVVKVRKKRTTIEVIIILVIIIGTAVAAFALYQGRSVNTKDDMLRMELSQIRSVIATYMEMNQTRPASLDALAKFGPVKGESNLLSNIQKNKKGEYVDPFGNPYKYDPETARVSSSTKDYSNF